MPAPVRVSAVSFLNARPLVHGLDRHTDLFTVQFDLPSICAARLHAADVDLGLIPAIEYLRDDYRLVPDIAIGSDGPILSVAVFTRVPMSRVRRLALDTSSRTSAMLTKVLCARLWNIQPEWIAMPPVLDEMLVQADAALLIGDPALDVDPDAAGVEKVDLGLAWQELTGLPFVYAVWAGRPGVLSGAHVSALSAAKEHGLAAIDEIAAGASTTAPARVGTLASYLRHNLRYHFGEREQAGLATFFALAADVSPEHRASALRLYP